MKFRGIQDNFSFSDKSLMQNTVCRLSLKGVIGIFTSLLDYNNCFFLSLISLKAADNPTVTEIRDVCQSQGLHCEVEVGVHIVECLLG